MSNIEQLCYEESVILVSNVLDESKNADFPNNSDRNEEDCDDSAVLAMWAW